MATCFIQCIAILGVRLIDECDLYKSFVPTFNAILGVRLIDECDLYSRQYGTCTCNST